MACTTANIYLISTYYYLNYISYILQKPDVRQISTVYFPSSVRFRKLHFSCNDVKIEMTDFYTLEITLQMTVVEKKTTVYFPLSVVLGISQTPVTQRLRNEASGTSHFVPPGMRQNNYGLTVLTRTIWRDTLVESSLDTAHDHLIDDGWCQKSEL
jgi:hypothetical protein